MRCQRDKRRKGAALISRFTSSLKQPQEGIAYVLTYFIVAEWLYPLPEISDTGFLPFLLLIAAVFFVITAIPVHWLIRLGFYAVVLTYSLHMLFIPGTYMSIDWWTLFMTEIWQQSARLFSGGVLQLSDMYRSFLLIVLLAMVSYLAYYWVAIAHRIYFFVFVSVVYIGILDAFTAYDGSWAVVRLVIIGFVLFACMRLLRLQLRYSNLGHSHVFRYLTVAAAVILLSVLVGWQAPKYAQQWPDPTPYIERTTGVDVLSWGSSSPDGAETRKIGYGENDERLGGGFVMDDMEVFTARAETSAYWRGESKHEYTGHGWTSEEGTGFGNGELIEQSDGHVDLYEDTTETETLEADVSYHDSRTGEGDLLFSQGALQEADAEMEGGYSVYIDGENGRSEVWHDEEDVNDAGAFTLTYEHPQFSVEQMRDVDDPKGAQQDPQAVTDKYLQLPEELPDRVGELAEELVQDGTNRYDRARAIESFLNGPTFDYETTDIPVPAEDQDYVDQFLFETQIGYCDNFSTAMVVMLRTLDIPARWVKGFTAGDEVSVGDDGYRELEITNENAHSWIEVYFPDVGWVPFEPTPGFSGTVDFASADMDPDENGEDMMFEQEVDQDTEEGNADEDEDEEDVGETEAEEREEEQAELPFWLLAGMGTGLLLAGLAAFKFRGKIMQLWLSRRYLGMDSGSRFLGAYESLLKYLDWTGMKRAAHETLSEFATRVDFRFDSEDMRALTTLYEDLYYGNKNPDQLPEDTERRWKQILDKIANAR
ncbi:DUF4129 domain-containing protein [Salicibibacter halophilus]|uniref:DUF4129 domain-containing protein n=1 Tax=Salicibibacter halophilus TaxID=2502791 RepID=A0A514LL56_9BACI|nr:transglutaminase domain-containing protein [Salicibibacter halophilus]QDI92597.1 DUF4129 domain-containing protein [Salicibibacter halophilus]